MDRLRHLIGISALLMSGCPQAPGNTAPAGPGRFAAVKVDKPDSALGSFCEKSFPASGPGSRVYAPMPERPIPLERSHSPSTTKRWTWINLWATWCNPCMEEMKLLGRWEASLARDGAPFRLELWSVDEDAEALQRALKKPIPGQVRWARSPQDAPAFMETLGLAKDTPIPIHVLVDPRGMLRCVRVGSVHEEDYGRLKSILGSG